MSKLLLKTENLKHFFLLERKGFLKPKSTYLKANNGIDLQIYQSETLGLVGESGCGKSTYGRVLLQLYEQTRGNTIYYGRSLYEVKPQYVLRYLQDLAKYRQKVEDLKKKANERDEHTILDEALRLERLLVRLSGSLYLCPDVTEAQKLLIEEYHNGVALFSNPEDAKLIAEQQRIRQAIDTLSQTVAEHPLYAEYAEVKDYGIDLTFLNKEEMRLLRRDLQIIFQDPYSSLNPKMTVGQLISEALIAHGMFKESDPQLEAYVLEIMGKCELNPSFIHRYPHQFSGGQRQRIVIARALALKPKFIVCDEAVSALDVLVQAQIIKLLQKLKQEEQLTYLFISHDLSVINNICDRIGVMYFGDLVELADNYELFDNPLHPYTKKLLSAIPSMSDRQIINTASDEEEHQVSRMKQLTNEKLSTQERKVLREVAPKHFVGE